MAVPKPALRGFSITRAPGAVPLRRTRPWPLLSTITTSRFVMVCLESDCTHSRSLESAARVGITTVTRKSCNSLFYLLEGGGEAAACPLGETVDRQDCQRISGK